MQSFYSGAKICQSYNSNQDTLSLIDMDYRLKTIQRIFKFEIKKPHTGKDV
jgi:hypothetical protein